MSDVVREFLKASSFMTSMTATFEKQFEQLRQLGIPDAESTMLEFFKQHMDQIISEAGQVVSSQFTEEELLQLTEFYKTPLGQMMTSKMPAVGSQVNMLLMSWVQHAQEELEVKLFEDQVAKH